MISLVWFELIMDQSFTKDLSLQNLSPSSKLTRDEEYMNSVNNWLCFSYKFSLNTFSLKVLDHEAQTEKLYHTERAANEQILWNNFQHTAAAIAQLYKGNVKVETFTLVNFCVVFKNFFCLFLKL